MADRKITITMSLNDLVSSNLTKIEASVKRTEQGFQKMEDSTKKSASGLEKLNKVLQAGVAIWGATKVFGAIGDMNDLGMAVKNASGVFGALQGSSAQAADTMRQLRGATMGVVDDMTLMSSSNRLMQMGLASTNDDLVKFTKTAVTLGRAMGQDTNTALENFALMVSNKSYLRLDTYGISAGAVRDRVNELKEATEGLSTEQAFLQATMEQADIAMQRIEGTAAATGTSFERLQTRIENVKQELARLTAQGVETGAVMVDALLATLEHPEDDITGFWAIAEAINPMVAKQRADLLALQDEYGPILEKLEAQKALLTFIEHVHSGITGWVSKESNWWAKTAEETRDYFKAIQPFTEFQAAYGEYTSARSGRFNMPGDMNANAVNNLEWERKQTDELQKQFDLVQKIYDKGDLGIAQYQQAVTMLDAANNALASTEARATTYAQTTQTIFNDTYDMMNKVWGADTIRDFGGVQIMSESSAEQLGLYTDAAGDILSDMERMNKLDLITDEDLEGARSLMDTMTTMSDKAWEAARAIDAMNLDQLLGRTGGGVVGQVGDLVIADMEAKGATPEEIASMQSALDLQSGRETAFGQTFEQEILPMFADLASEVGAEESARLVQVAADAIVEGRKQGFSDAQLLGYVQLATGYQMGEGGGMGFTVSPGNTPGALAAQMGVSVEDILAWTGASSATTMPVGNFQQPGGGVEPLSPERMSELQGMLQPTFEAMGEVPYEDLNTFMDSLGSDATKEGSTTISGAMTEMATAFGNFPQAVADSGELSKEFAGWQTSVVNTKTEFESMIGIIEQSLAKPFKLKISLDILGGGPLGSALQQAVRDNGGTVPGADNRSRGNNLAF